MYSGEYDVCDVTLNVCSSECHPATVGIEPTTFGILANITLSQIKPFSEKDQSPPPRKIKSGFKDSVELKLQPVPHEPPTSRSNERSQQSFLPLMNSIPVSLLQLGKQQPQSSYKDIANCASEDIGERKMKSKATKRYSDVISTFQTQLTPTATTTSTTANKLFSY